jgi:hypothetical protein
LVVLPEGHAEAEGYEMGKLTETVKVIDAALFVNFRTQCSVFNEPDVHAAPEVIPILRRGALPIVKAVASGRKRLDPPAASIAKKVVRRIN